MIFYQKNLVLLSSLIVAFVTVPFANAADQFVPICMGGEFTSQDECDGGQLRKAIVHIPTDLPSNGIPNKLPLVLSLHGAAGNGAENRPDRFPGQQKYTGFDTVADREKIVVAYPYGFEKARIGTPFPTFLPDALTWNAGGCCADACDRKIDDIGYLRELVRHIQDEMPKEDFVIDPERIYATGMSNGGMMTNRIGCEMSDIVAAIVPVAGPLVNEAAKNPNAQIPWWATFPPARWIFEAPFLWDSDPFECNPGRPVPVLHFHHVDDKIVPFNGNPPLGFPTVDSSIQKWRTVNGVDDVPGVITTFDDGMTTCTSYGPTSKNVTLCKIDDGKKSTLEETLEIDHCWPGKGQGHCGNDVGNEFIWEFMKQYTLSGGDAIASDEL